MTNNTLQQEIILVTTSTFSQRELCGNDSVDSRQGVSQIEKLEEACWNGLLNELLPEIVEQPEPGKKIFIWHVRHGESFLQMELSEFPPELEQHLSIDANLFLQTIPAN